MTIICLHGSMGSTEDLAPLSDAMSELAEVLSINLHGHGGKTAPEKFTMEGFAADVLSEMDSRGIKKANFMGYSFGGLLALWLAKYHPERVKGLVLVATKYVFDSFTVEHWVRLLELDYPAQCPSSHGRKNREEDLIAMHAPVDWKDIQAKSAEFFQAFESNPPLSVDEIRSISAPSLVVYGKQDPVVSEQESAHLAGALGASNLIVSGSAHPVFVLPLKELCERIDAWLKKEGLY